MITFGDKIKELRKSKGITQDMLATALGVSLGTIGMYETNKINPSPEILLKISEYFDISMDELFGKDKV